MTLERTAKVNALTALPRAVDLGIDARKPLTDTQITETSHWRARDEELALSTARAEAVRLAKRITTLDAELKDNHTRTTELLEASPAAPLLEETGIGTVTAAVVYTAWSHLGRVRSEAAFAALAGANPTWPPSSGWPATSSPGPMTNARKPKARTHERPAASSRDISPGTSTAP
ncbi:hypothetical protein NicSoilB8_17470 [Arthrobacter sp. NicSoilB8]|nr:hypothetical protein NicSoilB8_17470 [Arthrobacter sp. NicSoilB8]